MRVPRFILGVVAGTLLCAQPARADLIEIDPNDYAIGTHVSTMFDGINMWKLSMTGGTAYNPIRSSLVVDDTISSDTLGIGGTSRLMDYESCYRRYQAGFTSSCSGWSVIELLFDRPTDFVEMGSVWWEDSPTMIAYDVAGNVINRCDTAFGGNTTCASTTAPSTPGGAYSMTMHVNSATAEIARVVFGGTVGSSTATQVRYNVPEPATIAIVGIGLAMAMVRRRRRQDGLP